MPVAEQLEVLAVGNEGEKRGEDPLGRSAVAAAGGALGPASHTLLLDEGAATRSGVGHRVEPVEEPGEGAHGGGDAEGEVLGELEGLEVVENDGLGQASPQESEGAGVKKESMPPEAGGQAGEGGRSAGEGACGLTEGGAGLKSRREGQEEFGALEVVGGGEGLA
jgi:hypothetical protein